MTGKNVIKEINIENL